MSNKKLPLAKLRTVGRRKFLTLSFWSDLSGNRTRVYAVRGRRLDRLTNRPYHEPIEATRFELAASASRTQRSTKLSHASIPPIV